MRYINADKFKELCQELCDRIKDKGYKYVYGVPRGGCLVALYINGALDIRLKESKPTVPDKTVLIVDDLIDSGNTRNKYKDFDFEVLIDKQKTKDQEWIEFWYENTNKDFEDLIVRQLEFIGEDASREGLASTPKRVKRMYNRLFYGYNKELKVMDEIERNKNLNKEVIPITIFNVKHDELLIRNTKFNSFCEHHLVPFQGIAYVGIIPNKKLLGMNKIDKIVKYFGARLQIQERMTTQIANWIWENIKPQGVIVVIKANHLCAELQGDNGNFTTSAIKGVFKDKPESRAEFLRLME